MTKDDVLDKLRKAVNRLDGQRKWAAQAGVSQQYVADVLAGRREPGQKILDGLGLERVVSYRQATTPRRKA